MKNRTFADYAKTAQKLKNVCIDHAIKRKTALAADQWEALDMIFHNIGRIINGNQNMADNWDDIAEYAKLVKDRLNGKKR